MDNLPPNSFHRFSASAKTFAPVQMKRQNQEVQPSSARITWTRIGISSRDYCDLGLINRGATCQLVEMLVRFIDRQLYPDGLMVEQAEAGSIFPLRMMAHSARGDALSMHNCNTHPGLHDRTFLISWLKVCSTTLASFPSTPSHETTKGDKWRLWSWQAWRYFFL